MQQIEHNCIIIDTKNAFVNITLQQNN